MRIDPNIYGEIGSKFPADRIQRQATPEPPVINETFTKQETSKIIPLDFKPGNLSKTNSETQGIHPPSITETSAKPAISAETEQPSTKSIPGLKGAIPIIEESTDTLLTAQNIPSTASGEVNFAERFGVVTSESSSIPKTFSTEEVEKHYYVNGPEAKNPELTPAGVKFYETIKAKYIDSIPKCPYGSPTLTLTGGLPGSGKGYILSKIMGDKPEFILVDPDEIKKDMMKDLAEKNPELKEQMSGEKLWGDMIHETSSDMAKRLMNDALDSGKDIVFDSSMGSANVGKYRNYANRARANGYKVNGIISQVTVDVAAERALKRASRPTVLPLKDGSNLTLPGRLTRRPYIESCTEHLKNNLNTYLKEGLYDRCVVFDNSIEGEPAKVEATYKREQMPDGSYRNVPV
jgi:predicted kinase